MIFLILSILSSVITVSFFKLFEKYRVHTFQAIMANYVVCIVMGNLIADRPVITTPFWTEAWFPYTLALGFLFLAIFYCIGETAQKMGVSVSMVAAKLSVVIPVVFAVILHHEHLSMIKAGGIGLSLLAVYLISKKNEPAVQGNKKIWLLPVAIFIGSGMIDTLLNFVEARYIPPADAGGIVSTIFLIAFLLGCFVLLYRYISSGQTLQVKNILWGFALGLPNYFTMFFLVKTLGYYDASRIFPVNNIGIVVFSTLTALLLFREKLDRVNWAGFALAIVSILIISFL